MLTISLFFTYQGVMALDQTFAQAKTFDAPIREQSIIVSSEGYYPKNITVFAGERVRFFLTSTNDQISCLLIPEKNVFISAKKGKLSEGEAFFENAGTHKFYCPTGKISGKITVLQKPGKIKPKRDIASKAVRVWMPREE